MDDTTVNRLDFSQYRLVKVPQCPAVDLSTAPPAEVDVERQVLTWIVSHVRSRKRTDHH
jgi:hypothetical protein